MIKHIKCDIFKSGADIICHQVNCQGVMGSGIAKQVKDRYPSVYEEYKRVCRLAPTPSSLLGLALGVRTNEDVVIVNLFAQENYGYDGKQYTSYGALKNCFESVRNSFSNQKIAIPYLLGCHRGGGDWNVVYAMIKEIFADCDVILCEYNGG